LRQSANFETVQSSGQAVPNPGGFGPYLITGGGMTQEPPFWTITVAPPFVSVSVAAICDRRFGARAGGQGAQCSHSIEAHT
jgi:hypothetical protein